MSNKKFKNYKNIEKLKIGLKKALPQKIASVIQSYEEFSENETPLDSKSFNAFHGACKSAVIHAETLFKLSKWIEEENDENKSSDNDKWQYKELPKPVELTYKEKRELEYNKEIPIGDQLDAILKAFDMVMADSELPAELVEIINKWQSIKDSYPKDITQ